MAIQTAGLDLDHGILRQLQTSHAFNWTLIHLRGLPVV
jgi:hypothetical protein